MECPFKGAVVRQSQLASNERQIMTVKQTLKDSPVPVIIRGKQPKALLSYFSAKLLGRFIELLLPFMVVVP